MQGIIDFVISIALLVGPMVWQAAPAQAFWAQKAAEALAGCRMIITPAHRRGGRDLEMAEIRIKENESLDSALRRFKRSCAKSGVLAEVRKREHYEKPSVKRKKKSEAARKRKFK